MRGEVSRVRLKEHPNAAQQPVGDHQRFDRPVQKITPRIDQRISGLPEFQIEQGVTRREIIANLTRQVFQSLNKAKLMEGLPLRRKDS